MVCLDVTALSYEELLARLNELSLSLAAVKCLGERTIIECQPSIANPC